MAIIGIVDPRPDQSFAVDRLLRNQDDIGDAIKPFYGDAAGEQLTSSCASISPVPPTCWSAAKTGRRRLDGALTAWYANGDEIAAFLATANPATGRAEMQADDARPPRPDPG